MRRLLRLAGTLVAVVNLLPLCTGCSGTGAPAEPAGLAELRAVANDHVTALLLVKRWFSIMYVRVSVTGSGRSAQSASCPAPWEPLPSEPGDPPGSKRWRGTMSDCAVITALICADGAGWHQYEYPDGRRSRREWDAPHMDGPWEKTSWRETHSDGSRMEYEKGFNFATGLDDTYLRGVAYLSDDRSMTFDLERNVERDHLDLSPDDRSRLDLEVPVTTVPGAPFWPIFTQGAKGAFVNSQGTEYALSITGSGDTRWENWELVAPDGTTGNFALAADLSGSGNLNRGHRLLAALRWEAAGGGTLEPVAGSAIAAAPSAAARDFAFDRWIGNVAALAPMPMY